MLQCAHCSHTFNDSTLVSFFEGDKKVNICPVCEPEYVAKYYLAHHKPTFFVNAEHHQNFLRLSEEYSKHPDKCRYTVAAYINSLPSIYPKVEGFLFHVPFVWKYNATLYVFTDHRTSPNYTEYRMYFDGELEDSDKYSPYFKSLTLDEQKIVTLAEKMFNANTINVRDQHMQHFLVSEFRDLGRDTQRIFNQLICIGIKI